MKTFEYWSIKYEAQPFSLYLHNRIGLSKGVTLFVGVIIQYNEFWGSYDNGYKFANEQHAVTRTEYSQTLKWLRSQNFADLSIVYDGGCKATSIKIDFKKFKHWLKTDKGFSFEPPILPF
jgi:hypothetical protein